MAGVKVKVTGTEELRRLGIALEAAADGRELRRDLGRNIRASTKPAIAAAKANLQAELPHRGGLSAFFADASFGTRTSLRGRSVGVRIVARKKGHDIAGLDTGVIRHPVFMRFRLHAVKGRKFGIYKRIWVAQDVKPEIVSKPLADSKPEVRQGVIDAMDAVADRIARSS